VRYTIDYYSDGTPLPLSLLPVQLSISHLTRFSPAHAAQNQFWIDARYACSSLLNDISFLVPFETLGFYATQTVCRPAGIAGIPDRVRLVWKKLTNGQRPW
jgi:hypothetical protein